MGDILSVEVSSNFADNLKFLQSTEDNNFGNIDIYRMTTPPYEYIFSFKKSYIQNNQNLNRYFALMQKIKIMNHSAIAKIHVCEIIGDKQLCIKHKEMHAYCTYYNFTFEQAIAKKIETKGSFLQEEIVYIMSSLVDLAIYLEAAKISFGNYRTGNIYLSPQGMVKVYLLNLEQGNKHNGYYTILTQTKQINQYTLAPEQLVALRNKQYSASFDYYKADMFSIAMVILKLMYLDQSKFYYNQERKEILISKILFGLEIAEKRYSKKLIELIKWCFQVLPQNRCSFKQASKALADVKTHSGSSVNCIRLDRVESKQKGPGSLSINIFNPQIKDKTRSSCNSLTKKASDEPISFSSSISHENRGYRTSSYKKN